MVYDTVDLIEWIIISCDTPSSASDSCSSDTWISIDDERRTDAIFFIRSENWYRESSFLIECEESKIILEIISIQSSEGIADRINLKS